MLGDGDESREGGVGGWVGAPADDEATFGGGAGEGPEDHFGGKVFGLGGAHERRAHTCADEADAVSAGPDFFGDARRHSRGGEGGEDAVVETRVVRAGEEDEGRGREIAQVELSAPCEWMIGGEEDTVFFLKQNVSAQAGRGRVGMEKAAGEVAGLKGGELGGGGGFGELEFDARMAAVELAQDRREDGGHGEAGEGDAHVADLAVGEGFEFSGQGGETAEEGFDAFEEVAASGGEFGTAAGAVEEVGAEGGLELGERAAESGLGDREGFRGFAKVELAGQLAEIDEVA